MGKKSLVKGKRIEYEVRDVLREILAPTKANVFRIAASGAAEGDTGDLKVEFSSKTLFFEVKGRKSPFKQIQEWLSQTGCLAFRADRQKPIFIFTPEALRELVEAILHEGKRGT